MKKTLQQIKNDVALEKFKKYGCKDWFEVSQLTFSKNGILYSVAAMKLIDEVAKRYAIEAIKADRERVANSATLWVETPINGTDFKELSINLGSQNDPFLEVTTVFKDSILNLSIELP